jgi:hypothetical protein
VRVEIPLIPDPRSALVARTLKLSHTSWWDECEVFPIIYHHGVAMVAKREVQVLKRDNMEWVVVKQEMMLTGEHMYRRSGRP